MVEAMAAGVPTEPLARYFECWLLRLQGVYPAGRVPSLSRGGAGVSRRGAEGRRRSDAGRSWPPIARCCASWSRCIAALIAMHLEKRASSRSSVLKEHDAAL